jgi:uncharacterized membrane protein
MAHVRRLLRLPTYGGIVLGVVFWTRSLFPLLLPRSVLFQAVVGAVSLAVGIALGTLGGWLVHLVLARLDRRPSENVRRRAWQVLPVVGGAAVIAGSLLWVRWQNDHRSLLDMPDISAVSILPMLVLTAVVAVIVIVIGRLVWSGVRWIDRTVSKRMNRWAAIAVTIVIVWFLSSQVLARSGNAFHDWANATYGAVANDEDPDIAPPTSDTVAGGPGSLVPWESLGREGRRFVASATPAEELAQTAPEGVDVVDPVRVYVGLESADSAEDRAALAVEELERAGGFDRSLLVVWTVTGTGWVDPDATVALEHVRSGDTAIVAQQYSFLPSWISTLVDGPVARAAGAELFNAVHERWLELPEDDRPELVVFGLSLGSYGGEAPFIGIDDSTSIASLLTRTDGALFVGPTNGNDIWTQLTDGREPGSPAWRPVIGDGTEVVFANDVDEVEDVATVGGVHVMYLQHPTDPVTFWNWQSMWSRPDWLEGETGKGVAAQASWFPFVTFAQLVADLSAGFGAEPGFGHDYTDAYVAAWAAVAPPDGWTSADTQRVEAFLDVPR